MNKKDAVVIVLATLCLAIVLVTVVPVGSTANYDPWLDSPSGDGRIDVRDVAPVSAAYGSTGDPTKPVVVASLSTYEWTGHQIVSGGQGYWSFFNSTRGYRSVSIIATIGNNNHVSVMVSFVISGTYANLFTKEDRLELWDVYTVNKTYEVAGSSIYFYIYTIDPGSIDVAVGIYMTT